MTQIFKSAFEHAIIINHSSVITSKGVNPSSGTALQRVRYYLLRDSPVINDSEYAFTYQVSSLPLDEISRKILRNVESRAYYGIQSYAETVPILL